MATGGLYGNASESVGLYGNTTNFGGSYFEWFIFYQSDTQPATPTGGSWSFTTNSGTPPTGWSVVPFPAPTLPVWVSIALVNSRSDVPLVWSAPGLFSYSSGLPILSGSGTPAVGDGINSQLYVQTSTTPQTIWFKQSGTWNRLVGSTLYADLTSAQTVAGIKTFSSPIVGSVTGTSANVTGIVDIANGGTSSTTANGAFNALAPSQTSQAGKYLTTDGTNASWGTNPLGTVTSVDVSGGTTGLTTSGGPVTTSGTITLAGTLAVANGGTGATTTGVALTNLGAVGTIASADASIVVTRVGSSVDLSVSTTSPASVLLEQVRNTTGATLTKGTAVYISGATGQIPTVSKALATSDATSAQTLGLITSNLANNSNGYVTIIGLISDLDTSAYTDGQQLYLSPITAGTLTATKPYAPQHLVYMAVVAHAHPTQGKLLVKVQNGYELDELHNVAAQSPTTGQTIVWNSATSLWEKNTVSLTVGVNGTLPILNGGTGQTTANGAFNALAPSQTGNSGKYLTTDGTDTSWASNPLGTVTSVAATVPSFLSIAGSPITTSGTLAISLSGTALPTTSGGTGLTSFTSGGVVYASSTSALATGSALTFDGSQLTASRSTGGASGRFQNTGVNEYGVLQISGSSRGGIFEFLNGSTLLNAIYATTANDLIFTTGVGYAENFRITPTSLYTASGINVAIGASSAGSKLDVVRSATTTTAFDESVIRAINTGAATLNQRVDIAMRWQDGTYNGIGGISMLRESATARSGALVFSPIGSDGNPLAAMTLNSAGNLSVNGAMTTTSQSGFILNYDTGNRIKSFTASQSSPKDYLTILSAGSTGGWQGATRFGVSYNGGTVLYPLELIANTDGTTATVAVLGNITINGLQAVAAKSYGYGGGYSAIQIGLPNSVSGNVALGVDVSTVAGGGFNGANQVILPANGTLFVNAAGTNFIGGIGRDANNSVLLGPSLTGGITQGDVVITSAGNVGIGTNSVVDISGGSGKTLEIYGGSQGGFLHLTNSTTGQTVSDGFIIGTSIGGSDALLIQRENASMIFRTNDTERARIDSSGNLLVGDTAVVNNELLLTKKNSGTQSVQRIWNTATSGDNGFIVFVTEATNTERGGITYNRTAGLTSFNTTSDYRAKDIYGPITGSGALIDSVPVYMGKMKDATQERPMFIAHETPNYAHTGEKDAVDSDGKPVYQQMDASALIPVMWAEIQSLRKRLADAGI